MTAACRYEIRVAETLESRWLEWFLDLEFVPAPASAGPGTLLRGSLPVLDGTQTLQGLSQPVQISRDGNGTVTLTAGNDADAARAHGQSQASGAIPGLPGLVRAAELTRRDPIELEHLVVPEQRVRGNILIPDAGAATTMHPPRRGTQAIQGAGEGKAGSRSTLLSNGPRGRQLGEALGSTLLFIGVSFECPVQDVGSNPDFLSPSR